MSKQSQSPFFPAAVIAVERGPVGALGGAKWEEAVPKAQRTARGPERTRGQPEPLIRGAEVQGDLPGPQSSSGVGRDEGGRPPTLAGTQAAEARDPAVRTQLKKWGWGGRPWKAAVNVGEGWGACWLDNQFSGLFPDFWTGGVFFPQDVFCT